MKKARAGFLVEFELRAREHGLLPRAPSIPRTRNWSSLVHSDGESSQCNRLRLNLVSSEARSCALWQWIMALRFFMPKTQVTRPLPRLHGDGGTR